ncbi:hypothetical protein WJX74_010263 [Apatococcus lobatus]|uniref:BZIP domain-containing protein n=1 Tax=Apatococcus lobatus TaxID=904363 RepID=A0AAW1RM46_9CHLO
MDQQALVSTAAAASHVNQSQLDPFSQRHGSVHQPCSNTLLSRQSWQGPVLTLQQQQTPEQDEPPPGSSHAWPAMNQPRGVATALQHKQAQLQLHHAQPAHRIQLFEASVVQPPEDAVPFQPSQPHRRQQHQQQSQQLHEESLRPGNLSVWGHREDLPGDSDPVAQIQPLDPGWPFDASSPLAMAGRPSIEPGTQDPAISSSDHAGSQDQKAEPGLLARAGSSPDADFPSQAEESQAGPCLRRGPKRRARAAVLSLADLGEDADEPPAPAAGKRRGRRRGGSASAAGGLGIPEDQLVSMGSKRASRVLANRQSAARSKERKEQYTMTLEGQVESLQAELTCERAQMKQLREDMKSLEAANQKLRQQTDQLRQQIRQQLHPAATQQARWQNPESQAHAMPTLPFTQELSSLQVPLYPNLGGRAQSRDISQTSDLPRSGQVHRYRAEAPDMAAHPMFSMPQILGSRAANLQPGSWQLQQQQLDEPVLQSLSVPASAAYSRPLRQEHGTLQTFGLPTSTADSLTSLHNFL